MLFQTERLLIRKLQETDIEEFYDMQRNPNVMRYIKPTMNRSESEAELKRFMEYYDDIDSFFNIWAVEHKDLNDFIGICGVYQNDKSEYEIAYRIRECYWKKGFGSEVAKKLLHYCFEEMNISELAAYVRVANEGSVTILDKEMELVKEFYCKKAAAYERLYTLKKENWLSPS